MRIISILEQVLYASRLVRLSNSIVLGLFYITCQERYLQGSLTIHEYVRALTWVLLAAFAYAYNDIRDIEVDRINRPTRVLPSGLLTLRKARQLLLGVGILALVLILTEWRFDAFWPIGALIGSMVYSRFLRSRSAFLSNIVASLLVVVVPLSSGSMAAMDPYLWYLALGVGLLIFARELQKDALDMPGDICERPMPLLLGQRGRLFSFAYPVIVLVSGIFLAFATASNSGPVMGRVGPVVLAGLLSTAALLSIANQTKYRTQSLVTKIASYLLVLILAIRAI